MKPPGRITRRVGLKSTGPPTRRVRINRVNPKTAKLRRQARYPRAQYVAEHRPASGYIGGVMSAYLALVEGSRAAAAAAG